MSDVCPEYDTTELPSEISARGRREAAQKAKKFAAQAEPQNAVDESTISTPVHRVTEASPTISKELPSQRRPGRRKKDQVGALASSTVVDAKGKGRDMPPTSTPTASGPSTLPSSPINLTSKTPLPKDRSSVRENTAARKAKVKLFNLQTYKLHALGGYAKAIRRHGTTDNYSSQLVRFPQCIPSSKSDYFFFKGELEHKRPKRHYHRVSKSKHIYGIAMHVSRERRIHVMRARQAVRARAHGLEKMPASSIEVHHQISQETRNKIHIPMWLKENSGDPCLEVFNL